MIFKGNKRNLFRNTRHTKNYNINYLKSMDKRTQLSINNTRKYTEIKHEFGILKTITIRLYKIIYNEEKRMDNIIIRKLIKKSFTSVL